MKKILLVTACILGLSVSSSADAMMKRPTNVCEYLQYMDAKIDRMESSINQRLDQMDTKINQMGSALSSVTTKAFATSDDVQRIKETIGSFDSQPKVGFSHLNQTQSRTPESDMNTKNAVTIEILKTRAKDIILTSKEGKEVSFPNNFNHHSALVKELLEETEQLDPIKIRRVDVPLTETQLLLLKDIHTANNNKFEIYTRSLEEKRELLKVTTVLKYDGMKRDVQQSLKYNNLFLYSSSTFKLSGIEVPPAFKITRDGDGAIFDAGDNYEISFDDNVSLQFVRELHKYKYGTSLGIHPKQYK